ncbi:MAG TPA: T9SS type A sorting domain-containing protein [Saprospiraceae bacterium]|nr:T9SS type A sorting domain-containing protein [Saprospiraceae bacterium]
MNPKINFLLAFLMLFGAYSLSAQCKKVGLIGEFTGWSADFELDRSPTDVNVFTGIVTFNEDNDTAPANDTMEVKFRELGDWGVNWGSADFPTGTGTNGGDNILAAYGTYFVTFNCSTGDYSFTPTCGEVSMIGEMNGWAGDVPMTRSESDPNEWTAYIGFSEADDTDPANDTIELKFRQDADWAVNWGSDEFPSGTGTNGGDNIKAPYGHYKVTFNCSTGAYNFESTCGNIGLIGEFNGWAEDYWLTRDATNPNMWTTVIDFNADNDPNSNDTIEVKFRQDSDWGVNWGDAAFPSGTGTNGGANIPALYGKYFVTFDCSTGDYTFSPTCGEISMIGAFNDWNGDVPMNRSAANPNEWTLTRSWFADSEVKFREDQGWTVNWGDSAWPSGTATDNGPNIPLVAGMYDVTFNCSTGAYSFTENTTDCGEISMVGDFNNWGINDDVTKPPTDLYLIRDATYPNLFSLVHNFTSSTKLLFRRNTDLTLVDAWGGTFPSGTGLYGDVASFFEVPGGTFRITFDCNSGDYNFERLGSSVTAPKVFDMAIDGQLNEADWDLNQNVSRVIDGDAGADPVTADFGVTYNNTYLFVGAKVIDADVSGANDGVAIFVDGNKSGGDYDDSDVFVVVSADGAVDVIKGPSGGITVDGAASNTGDGYAIEARIPWAALGVTPVSGEQISFDLGVSDYDAGADQSKIGWNGNISDTSSTSAFGDLLFGDLKCGNISMSAGSIGDVDLRPTTDNPNLYVGTYEFETDMGIVFRKDHSSTVNWGSSDFPTGTATINGGDIPATTGRYRVSFGCLDGAYSFTPAPADATVAYSQYTTTPNTIDGDLTEYDLAYGMDAGVVDGTGPNNNTVTWGSDWDENWLYLAAKVVDGVVEGAGNPWENDAIEMYIDGNHDSDGTYDADYDTQIIMDNKDGDVLWVKADGVQLDSIESKWLVTSNGYNVEVKLNWPDFSFNPGRNKSIGFTIGNNDSDNGLGRDYQTAWVGDGNNWNNTAVFGDLQLAGGPLVNTQAPFVNHQLSVYPNPSERSVGFYVAPNSNIIAGKAQIRIVNMMGQVMNTQQIEFSGQSAVRIQTNNLTPGIYIVHLTTKNGKQASKRIVIQ